MATIQHFRILVIQWVLHKDLTRTKCFLNPTWAMGKIPSARGLNWFLRKPMFLLIYVLKKNILVVDGRKCHRLLILFACSHMVVVRSPVLAWTILFSLIGSQFWWWCPTFVCSIPGVWFLNFRPYIPKISVCVCLKNHGISPKPNCFNPYFPNSIGHKFEGIPHVSIHCWNPYCWCLKSRCLAA